MPRRVFATSLLQNELPSTAADKEEVDVRIIEVRVDVCVIEVQVPFAQGVIAPISDVDGGEGSSSKAANTHKVA